jgi:hypothetical protein
MKRTLIIVAIVIAVLLSMHLAVNHVDVLGFLKRLHGG